jgi:CheY-like chemotaxis protein
MVTEDVSTPKVAGPLVLLVDDYDDSREMYAEFLELAGFRVCQARDGRQGVEKAHEHHPDLILMDLSLPGMDGWEAIKQLKSDTRTRQIPVIALSGHNQNDVSGQVGPRWDYFVSKPCQPEDLVKEMQRALSSAALSGGKQ